LFPYFFIKSEDGAESSKSSRRSIKPQINCLKYLLFTKSYHHLSTGYSDSEWSDLSTGAYAVYDDDPANADIYENFYNWYAIDLETGVCPIGWHVSTDEEIKGVSWYESTRSR